MTKRRNAWRYFAPENLDEGRGTGIVLGDCPVLLRERARAIVANLQARRLEVRLANAIGNGLGMHISGLAGAIDSLAKALVK